MDAFLNRLERRIGWIAVPHLTWLIVFAQVVGMLVSLSGQPDLVAAMAFSPQLVLSGQVWRVVAFLGLPISGGVLWQLIAIYFMFFVGSMVETGLGRFRYTLYCLFAWLATVGVSLGITAILGSRGEVSNWFIYESIILATAALIPEERIYVMFVIPVKFKWIGLISAGFMALATVGSVLGGNWANAGAGVTAFATYLIFFGSYHLDLIRQTKRRAAFRGKTIATTVRSLHRCAICDRTEKSGGDLTFRVCSTCTKGQEYCQDHLKTHTHE